MERKQITKRQKDLLSAIYNYIKDSGYPPTFEEMKDALGVKSNQSVLDHLKKLEESKLIKRNPGVARSLVVLPLGYKALGSPALAPFLGATSAGVPAEMVEFEGQWQKLPTYKVGSEDDISKLSSEIFFLKVHGDSMVDAGIDSGDTVLVESRKEFFSGDIVLADMGGESTIKRFITQDKPPYIYLKPENPKYEIILFEDDVELKGKVISVLRNGILEESSKMTPVVEILHASKIHDVFRKVCVEDSWAFADKTRKETTYLTHGYHRYPAKFIPQIVSRLVKIYTRKGDLVVDPFGGCGTTSIESKVMGRSSVGVDINPVAVLITKAKITSIEPRKVEKQFLKLKERLDSFSKDTKVNVPRHKRIDYWFKPTEKRKLAFLFSEISKIKNQDIRDFFYCGFSNILKNCSIWLQKSNKPTRDLKKIPADPFVIFSRQIKAMLRGNMDFYNLLLKNKYTKTPCKVYCADARKISVKPNSVDLIVTSPPYVTSYEYADLHQLTALWFEHTKDLSDFRKRFIGTSYHSKKKINLNSLIAEGIQSSLDKKHRKTAEEVATYFSEMNQVFREMKRILKKGARACIVIGNTSLKGVEILNAEVFVEQLQNFGFKIDNIIKREIPSKNLPMTRDKKTGRFARATDTKKVLAYPTEYILIMQKI